MFNGMFDLLTYCENTNECRHVMIEKYLYAEHEENAACLDSCDVCINNTVAQEANVTHRLSDLRQLLITLTTRKFEYRLSDLADFLQGRYTDCFGKTNAVLLSSFGVLSLFEKRVVTDILIELIKNKCLKPTFSLDANEIPAGFENFVVKYEDDRFPVIRQFIIDAKLTYFVFLMVLIYRIRFY